MSNAQRERRCKLLLVTPELMADLLAFNATRGRRHFGATIQGIPDEYQIEQVDYLPDHHAFGFLIYHPSFPVADPTQEPPLLLATITSHYDDETGPTIPVHGCSRCGQDHEVTLKTLSNPPAPYSHWARCPVAREPILISISVTPTEQREADERRAEVAQYVAALPAIDGPADYRSGRREAA
jgi:hypothetical protein